MPTQVAPGVYTKIIDQSIFATPIPGTTGFIPILSEKGEDNKLTFVSSQAQLVNTFGAPSMKRYGQALYNAFNFLNFSGNLYVIRPLPTIEDTSELLDSGALPAGTIVETPWINKPATFASALLCVTTLEHLGVTSTDFNPIYILSSFITKTTEEIADADLDISPVSYLVGRQELRMFVDGEPFTDFTEVGEPYSTSNIIHITGTIASGSAVTVLKVNTNYASTYAFANPHDRFVMIPRYPDPLADPSNPFTLTDDQTYLSDAWEEIENPPIEVILPFRFVPGQKQLKVYKVVNTTETELVLGTDYKELTGGNGIVLQIQMPVDAKIKVVKEGIVYATRYREKFLDPVTDTQVDHNLRTISSTPYIIRTLPSATTWLEPYWTYTSEMLDNSTQEDTALTRPLFFFVSKGRGKYYNNLSIKIRPILNTDKHYELRVTSTDPLFNSEVDLESFTVSFVPGTVDGTGNSTFVEDVLNSYSAYIQCYCNIDLINTLANTLDPIKVYARNGISTTFFDHTSDTPITVLDRLLSEFATVDLTINSADFAMALPLSGGMDGCLLNADGVTPNPTVMTKCFSMAVLGMYDPRVIDPEDNDISLVFDAGFPKTVKENLMLMCQRRGDCFAVLDLEKSISVNSAVQLRNTTYAYNTWQAALYVPYAKVYSIFEGTVITVAPSYYLSNVYPYSDSVSELWFAPAGPQRGTINPPEKLLFNAISGDLDILYMNQLNPIVYKNKRYMVYGQLTTQRKQSALSDVNIVRLILYLRKRLERTLSEFLFEQNDAFTWAAARRACEGLLADVMTRRGLYEYGVEASANEYEIMTKTFHVNVTIRPVRTVEKIMLNFIVK